MGSVNSLISLWPSLITHSLKQNLSPCRVELVIKAETMPTKPMFKSLTLDPEDSARLGRPSLPGCWNLERHPSTWLRLPSLASRLRRAAIWSLAFAVLLLGNSRLAAQSAAATPVSNIFNIESATRDYLKRLTPENKQRSDAYFEGGYWVQLWDFLYGTAVAVLLLQSGLSARMRNLANRLTRFKGLQVCAYWFLFVVATGLLAFPWTVYTGFFREHQYGLSNQTFGGWFGDFFKGELVSVVLGCVALIPIHAFVRRASVRWHVYASGVLIVFLMLVIVIAPVFIAPLFNKYTPLADPKVREPILSLARANGIPATEVYQMDASRQSKRISANVSGAFGTTRVTLNDNLLNRCSLAEIEAVMGHEMGHYVLNHVHKMFGAMAVLVVAMMAALRWSYERLLVRFGAGWRVTGPGDLAALPLAVALISGFGFVVTPVMNTLIRTQEMEADVFGLNASRQPDGFAECALKLSEYRKIEPGPIEEFLFYDHPSGATRIRTAMRWKAENLLVAGQTTPR
jgi:STE24 endopeptidase